MPKAPKGNFGPLLKPNPNTHPNPQPNPRGNVSAPGIFLDPCPSSGLLGGTLSAVQLFGRLAVLETHTLR